jgi:3-phenylpropionate/trans-cinnamate dioxygenase ferredoxin subunit
MSVAGGERAGPAGSVRVARLDELEPGTLREVEVDGTSVCLARTADGEVYAFRNNCSHRDFPLHTGELDGGQITCSWHGARFDVKSGRATRLPAVRPIRTFAVTVDDGDVFISLTR